MADQSYLFGGQLPSSVTGVVSDSATTLPAWLQEYTRALAGQATAVAGEKYQPYTPPTNAATYGQDSGRIAGFAPAQQQAQQAVQAQQGSYKPQLGGASYAQSQAMQAAQNIPGATQPHFQGAGAAQQLAMQTAQANQGSYKPQLGGASYAQSQAMQAAQNIPGATQPHFQGAGAAQQLAMQTAQANQGSYKPYLDKAGQALPQAVGNYMNPYTDSVVNRIAQLGQRNLTENLLPQINSTFTGAGQFGSTRNADFTNRAVRDANESILGQQASALQTGYQQASQNALADLQRQAQLGQLQQQLGQNEANLYSTLGSNQANLGSTIQNAGVQNSTLLDTLGLSQAQLGQLQQQLGQNEANLYSTLGSNQANLGSTIQNAGVQNSTLLNTLGLSQAQLGQLQQQLGYTDIGMLDTIGQQQQAQQQKNMDLATSDFNAQVNYPKTQLSFLSEIIRGMPTSTNSFSSTTIPGATTQQVSPLAAAAQGFLGTRSFTQQQK